MVSGLQNLKRALLVGLWRMMTISIRDQIRGIGLGYSMRDLDKRKGKIFRQWDLIDTGMCNWGSKNTRCVPRSKRLSTPSVDPAGSKTGLPVHCCWEPWMGALPIASILLIGPTIPILGICPKYSLAKIEYHVCMRLFIVVFFWVAKNWKHTTCQSIGLWF